MLCRPFPGVLFIWEIERVSDYAHPCVSVWGGIRSMPCVAPNSPRQEVFFRERASSGARWSAGHSEEPWFSKEFRASVMDGVHVAGDGAGAESPADCLNDYRFAAPPRRI